VNLRLNLASSRIAVRTFAEGLFARLAHDLEIVVNEASGEASGEAGEEPATASLRVPVRGLRVAGVVRGGRVNDQTLSASERADIELRMSEALGGAGAAAEITVAATLLGEHATLQVRTPRGTQSVSLLVQVRRAPSGAIRVRGDCKLSLDELGVPPVRGPVGAFRLADRVEVSFDASFEP
jgi:hypothetical protein